MVSPDLDGAAHGRGRRSRQGALRHRSGPEGSAGDLSWVVEARRSGTLPLLVVQAIVMSDLVQAADIVLPGASFVEKDAIYTNADGRVQPASTGDRAARRGERGLADPRLDCQPARCDAPLSERGRCAPRDRGGASGRPVRRGRHDRVRCGRWPRSHWLQSSNPSERWKWDFMYQDLPPVKGHNVQMEGVPGRAIIPLKPVE